MATVTVDFTGAHAFVAGGTSGINLGIAEGFAAAGARVTVMSRSPDKVDAAVRRLPALGAEAGGSAADVRDPDATATALQQANESFGEIDVLVSGAAGNFPGTQGARLADRLGVFATTTSPLIDYYRDRGILLAVDADQPPEAVTAEILTRLSDRSSIRERS